MGEISKLTQTRLKEVLNYDADTGLFIWIKPNALALKPGQLAGTTASKDGYVYIKIDSRPYKAHRLAWLFMTGQFPDGPIDHINRIKDDNRFVNLRVVTYAQNGMNKSMRLDNSTGHPGVYFRKAYGTWMAQIRHKGRDVYLGTYQTIDGAINARRVAAKDLFGEFYNDEQVCTEGA